MTREELNEELWLEMLVSKEQDKMTDRLRVIVYLFFNTDSIRHRVDPGKKTMNLLLPFLLLKLLIFDVIRIKKRNK